MYDDDDSLKFIILIYRMILFTCFFFGIRSFSHYNLPFCKIITKTCKPENQSSSRSVSYSLRFYLLLFFNQLFWQLFNRHEVVTLWIFLTFSVIEIYHSLVYIKYSQNIFRASSWVDHVLLHSVFWSVLTWSQHPRSVLAFRILSIRKKHAIFTPY